MTSTDKKRMSRVAIEGRVPGLICLILLLLIGSAEMLLGQRGSNDHRGREFRMAFLHTDGDDPAPAYYIVISTEVPGTTGSLIYEDDGFVVPIELTDANSPYRFRLDTNRLMLPDPIREEKSRRTIRLVFDNEVSIYGINTLRWSSDSYLALPIDALGLDYTLLSYPNTAEPGEAGQIFETSDFPSQFGIIATSNNTTVTIRPTASVNARGNTQAYTVNLDAGEVYFGQAIEGIRIGNPVKRAGADLTGTRIEANAPVIVYGSHQRSNIPWNDAVGRDHLIEQMPPTDHWGTRAMVTPHFQIPKTVSDRNFVRIVAAQPGTILRVDSGAGVTLPVGLPFELPLDRAKLLTATGPIAVAQYNHSTVDVEFISQINDTIGDPFMMLVPSREQFDTNYTFESWDTKDFIYHFANVVIPTEKIGTLVHNGQPLNASFSRIPKTSYSFAQLQLNVGAHNMRAAVPFGLYVYGYGPYNSYGMPGGWVFDSIYDDHLEPDIAWRDTCGGVVGAAFDTAATDFGMESLRLLPGSANVRLDVEPFEIGDDSIRFSLLLLDPFRDGFGELLAVDSAGLERRYRVDVKGFTMRLDLGEPPIRLDTLASLSGLEFCRSIRITNYGSFPQDLEQVRLRDSAPGLRVATPMPIRLQPGESRAIEICYQHVGDTAFSVEIGLDDGCLVREVGTLPVVAGEDTTAPVVVRTGRDCDEVIVYDIFEVGAFNSGIAEVTVRAQRNAEILIPSPNELPGRQGRIEIRRISIWEDLVYDIEVVDVAGNRVRLAETIGGLTLAVGNGSNTEQFGFRLDPDVPWLYDELVFTRRDCDTVWLENTGSLQLDLSRLRFSGNLQFSVPPEQLPISLAPGERFPVEVCVLPTASGTFRDTMVIEFFCGRLVDVVEFQAAARPLIGDGTDRCGNLIEASIGGATKGDFVEVPVPNPVVGGKAALRFGLSEERSVTLHLYDESGIEVRQFLTDDRHAAGIWTIHADLSDVPSGLYFLRMATEVGPVDTRPIVVTR